MLAILGLWSVLFALSEQLKTPEIPWVLVGIAASVGFFTMATPLTQDWRNRDYLILDPARRAMVVGLVFLGVGAVITPRFWQAGVPVQLLGTVIALFPAARMLRRRKAWRVRTGVLHVLASGLWSTLLLMEANPLLMDHVQLLYVSALVMIVAALFLALLRLWRKEAKGLLFAKKEDLLEPDFFFIWALLFTVLALLAGPELDWTKGAI